jgi:alanine dehydrogenase
LEKGIITKKDIHGTLGEIVAGKKPAREDEEEIIIYHNPGMTLQDLAIVNYVYHKANELGIGQEVSDPFIF